MPSDSCDQTLLADPPRCRGAADAASQHASQACDERIVGDRRLTATALLLCGLLEQSLRRLDAKDALRD